MFSKVASPVATIVLALMGAAATPGFALAAPHVQSVFIAVGITLAACVIAYLLFPVAGEIRMLRAFLGIELIAFMIYGINWSRTLAWQEAHPLGAILAVVGASILFACVLHEFLNRGHPAYER